MPRVFGYSEAEGAKVFPPYQFPPCSQVIETHGQSVFLNTETNKAEFNCKAKSGVQYFTGPHPDFKIIMPDEFPIYQQPKTLTERQARDGLDLTGTEEYVFANCGEDTFEYVSMRPRYNATAHEQARATIKHLESLGGDTQDPIHIFELTIDSLSRRHFHRKLPKT
jgi:hypothetical protein